MTFMKFTWVNLALEHSDCVNFRKGQFILENTNMDLKWTKSVYCLSLGVARHLLARIGLGKTPGKPE